MRAGRMYQEQDCARIASGWWGGLELVVGVLRHNKYLKAALHSTNVSIGTIVV